MKAGLLGKVLPGYVPYGAFGFLAFPGIGVASVDDSGLFSPQGPYVIAGIIALAYLVLRVFIRKLQGTDFTSDGVRGFLIEAAVLYIVLAGLTSINL